MADRPDHNDTETRGHGDTGMAAAGSSPNPASGASDASAAPGESDAQVPASPRPRVPESAGPAIPLSDVLAWLDARESPPPPELRARMAEALGAVKAETVPGALAEAALSCLQATMAQPADRASALDLLAADALLTYALEAAAELGAETLRRIASEYGPATLDRALPEEGEP